MTKYVLKNIKLR